MECQNCGKSAAEGSIFCPYCGIKLEEKQSLLDLAEKFKAESELKSQQSDENKTKAEEASFETDAYIEASALVREEEKKTEEVEISASDEAEAVENSEAESSKISDSGLNDEDLAEEEKARRKVRRRVRVVLGIVLGLLIVSASAIFLNNSGFSLVDGAHFHSYDEASCVHKATCSVCGKEIGDFADHEYADATCYEPRTCYVCGDTKGIALGHNILYDHTCSRCGYREPTISDWSFENMFGVTEFIRIYGYNLREDYVECRYNNIDRWDFYSEYFQSGQCDSNFDHLSNYKYLYSVESEDTIYIPSWRGRLFILDKIVIDENKKAIIIKFLDDEEGRERWYVSKNILDSSTMERDEEDDWLVRIYFR